MDIEEYRVRHGLSYAACGRHFGIENTSLIRRYALGMARPGPDRILSIIEKSGGEVTFEDIMARYRDYQTKLRNGEAGPRRVYCRECGALVSYPVEETVTATANIDRGATPDQH